MRSFFEILWAVLQAARHVKNWSMPHVIWVKHIFRYLKGARDQGIVLRKGGSLLRLVAYADADWAGEPEDSELPMRSISGFILALEGIGAIAAVSVLQKTLALSSCDAEYRSAAQCARVVALYQMLLSQLGLEVQLPTIIHEDNQGAIAMASNLISGARARHNRLDHYYLQQQTQANSVVLQYISTTDQVADILTKALPKVQFAKLRDILRNGL